MDIVRGAAFMYACHCTTLGSNDEVSGDWAGLSASRLEQLHAGSVWLPIIGCGADANPESAWHLRIGPATCRRIGQRYRRQTRRTSQQFTPLAEAAFPVAHFGYAGLAPEQPSAELIEQRQKSENPTERAWAEIMLETLKTMGRLPETYPMPIHTWQFGDALTWVFLGGEVVVDYQLQLEKELANGQTWVAAYTDDVFAYVASERMRAEGGYEVDTSMLYYVQPGRWQSGTQSLIVRRVREILGRCLQRRTSPDLPRRHRSHSRADGYRVDLVAAEPLVRDPINLAFGVDGRVWVVEMSDYPLGVEGGGRVKWMRDRDGDGTAR